VEPVPCHIGDQPAERTRRNARRGVTVNLRPRRRGVGRVAGDGVFDPLLLTRLVDLGYDRDFAAIRNDADALALSPAATTTSARRMSDWHRPPTGRVRLDPLVRAITLPPGTAFDPGGIGKGYAADQIATQLISAGARGVMVDLGGDIRFAGRPVNTYEADWTVRVGSPFDADDPPLAELRLAAGAVATSTSCRRHWSRDGERRHHLLDPRTGQPASTGLASVTVVAAGARWAEVFAKTVFVLGARAGGECLAAAGLTGLAVTDEGSVVYFPGIEEYLVSAVGDRGDGTG
jgi:thiamine biosynthesis lipoprotein